jgi:dihydrofolate synthase / folylpolyglutamate synthase
LNYAEAVQYLYSLGNEVQTAKLGLERITRLLDALGAPHRACKFVHVAGTNGKGSTCAMIEAGLRAGGVRTGLYTSPHLVEPVERIQIAGKPVSQEQFSNAFSEVHQAAERMLKSGDLDLHPTYFETITAMGFLLFRQMQVDTAVLEVGLGGRLDATNVVMPELCVITPIDFDHQAFLGDTIEQIAAEKAGILKKDVPAVFGAQSEKVEEVLRRCAKGPYILAREWPVEDVHLDSRGSRFRLRGAEISCPLAGEHQIQNARTAAIALDQLSAPVDGIAATRWPGRLEQISERPTIILDGAHNPAAARALARYIQQFYSDRRIWLVFGVMRDKAVSEIAALLFPLAHRTILTAPANSRAMPPENIPAHDATITHHVSEALELLNQAAPDDAVFITGSLFVVGEARSLLVK